MNIKELVLINDCGCEIGRQEITKEKSVDDIIDGWIIYPGDTIKVIERWTEC